ncbi:hypothetical protein ACE6ED_02425 [Paenibacillus sp. CN-4]|uniref:hypothetical protein n=1 Tax=Paenibacillus nanchangensis TaxID=3348343 RepID=UPI00397968F5
MSDSSEKGKINLADAIRQKLEQKKQQASSKPGAFQPGGVKTLKTQNNKKPNNQRRRTGGS